MNNLKTLSVNKTLQFFIFVYTHTHIHTKEYKTLQNYMKYKDKLRMKFDNQCQNNLSFMRFVKLKSKLFERTK